MQCKDDAFHFSHLQNLKPLNYSNLIGLAERCKGRGPEYGYYLSKGATLYFVIVYSSDSVLPSCFRDLITRGESGLIAYSKELIPVR